MRGGCTFRGIYRPEVGLICLQCHRSNPSEAFDKFQKEMKRYLCGISDEPTGIPEVAKKFLNENLDNARQLWTFNGAPQWLCGYLLDLGYKPQDPTFPVQPLTEFEIAYWSEDCWGCSHTWMVEASRPIREQAQVSMVADMHIQPHPCTTCPGLRVSDPECGICGKLL